MTTHLGTFIPLQAQSAAWGSQNLNQYANWGLTGWNPNAAWTPNSSCNSTAVWGQNTPCEQNASHNQQNASVVIVPAYGTKITEIAQNIAPQGSTVAFIPHQSQFSNGAFVPHQSQFSNGAFVPSNTALQGITPGTTFVGIPAGWQNGNQALSNLPLGNPSLSQSFAAELSENNHEFVLSFDVPGIDVEDLDVSLAGNTIFINGIRKSSNEATTLAYSEIAKGNITRAISVPFDVSPSKAINTSLDNGVLKIRIAKESQSDKRTSARKVKIG